jgi:predicted GIY-YIG superfamily endonuclease
MDLGFSELIQSVEPKYRTLTGMPAVKYTALPRELPARGVYLFSEGPAHLYVGRTNRLCERLRGHCTPSGSHFTATFAFRIARRTTGRMAASYSQAGSRANLLKNAEFAAAFVDAKRRIGSIHGP